MLQIIQNKNDELNDNLNKTMLNLKESLAKIREFDNQLNELNELSYLFRSALFNNTKFWEDAQLKKTTLRLSFVNTTCGYTVLFFVYVPLFTNNNTSLSTNSK